MIAPAAVVIQARMSSTRLPGKVLEKLGEVRVIDWVLQRSAMAKHVTRVVVATSTDKSDDVLADYVEANGWTVVRGSLEDVLDRYVDAVRVVEEEYIVRITGDCPFVQPELIDLAVETAQGIDYSFTGHDNRFPRGFDVEVVHREALICARYMAQNPLEREHVTPFIATRPDVFEMMPIPCPDWAQRPDLRVTLDQPEDLEVLKAVVDELGSDPVSLEGRQLIEYLDGNPEIVGISREVVHRTL